jgi:hypothetical protein
LAQLAGKELTAATSIAVPAVSAVPTDSDSLAICPFGNTRADGINDSNNLMPWNSRVLNIREGSCFNYRVATADPAGLDLDSHRSGTWLRDSALNKFEGSIRVRDLYDTHLGHSSSNRIFHQALHRCGSF